MVVISTSEINGNFFLCSTNYIIRYLIPIRVFRPINEVQRILPNVYSFSAASDIKEEGNLWIFKKTMTHFENDQFTKQPISYDQFTVPLNA